MWDSVLAIVRTRKMRMACECGEGWSRKITFKRRNTATLLEKNKSVELNRNATALRRNWREQNNRSHLADGLGTRLNNSPGGAATTAFVVLTLMSDCGGIVL